MRPSPSRKTLMPMHRTMKIFLIIITSLFYSHISRSQNNCFDSCYQNFDKSTLQFPKKNESILQNLVGCKLPDFKAQTVNGKTFSLKELSGKVIVINFYFAACAPCVAEIPALNKLEIEYKNKDVVFIAFTKDPTASALNFIKENGFKYNVITNLESLETRFCILGGWPTNMVIDKTGTLRQIFSGGRTDEEAKIEAYNEMKPMIEKCLNNN